MASLNISLPRPLKAYIEKQVKKGGYSTPSEYIRTLLREDQKRTTQEGLEALLLEGVNSGRPINVSASYWDGKRRQLQTRLRKSTKPAM